MDSTETSNKPISIRKITTSDTGEVSQLIKDIWSSEKVEIGEAALSVINNETEGFVLGAYHAGKLVGIKIIFLAKSGVHHSHMMGVKEEWRDKGVASELLREHITVAKEEGVQGITLTIDPFNYANTYLYLHNAGAVVKDAYEFDKYGKLEGINGSLPTDRFKVFLHTEHPDVDTFLDDNVKKEETPVDLSKTIVYAGKEDEATVEDGEYSLEEDMILVGMPNDFEKIEKNDVDKALERKKVVGEVFDFYLSHGYIVNDLLKMNGIFFYKLTKIDSLGKNKKYLQIKDKNKAMQGSLSKVKYFAAACLIGILYFGVKAGFKKNAYNNAYANSLVSLFTLVDDETIDERTKRKLVSFDGKTIREAEDREKWEGTDTIVTYTPTPGTINQELTNVLDYLQTVYGQGGIDKQIENLLVSYDEEIRNVVVSVLALNNALLNSVVLNHTENGSNGEGIPLEEVVSQYLVQHPVIGKQLRAFGLSHKPVGTEHVGEYVYTTFDMIHSLYDSKSMYNPRHNMDSISFDDEATHIGQGNTEYGQMEMYVDSNNVLWMSDKYDTLPTLGNSAYFLKEYAVGKGQDYLLAWKLYEYIKSFYGDQEGIEYAYRPLLENIRYRLFQGENLGKLCFDEEKIAEFYEHELLHDDRFHGDLSFHGISLSEVGFKKTSVPIISIDYLVYSMEEYRYKTYPYKLDKTILD